MFRISRMLLFVVLPFSVFSQAFLAQGTTLTDRKHQFIPSRVAHRAAPLKKEQTASASAAEKLLQPLPALPQDPPAYHRVLRTSPVSNPWKPALASVFVLLVIAAVFGFLFSRLFRPPPATTTFIPENVTESQPSSEDIEGLIDYLANGFVDVMNSTKNSSELYSELYLIDILYFDSPRSRAFISIALNPKYYDHEDFILDPENAKDQVDQVRNLLKWPDRIVTKLHFTQISVLVEISKENI